MFLVYALYSDGFVLPSLFIQLHIIACRRLKGRNYSYLAVNEPGNATKRSSCADLTSKLCNQENRVAAMRARPSASCQRGQYKGSKDHTFTVPEVPQLRTSKPYMHRLTPVSKYYKNPVTKEGRFFYLLFVFWGERNFREFTRFEYPMHLK